MTTGVKPVIFCKLDVLNNEASAGCLILFNFKKKNKNILILRKKISYKEDEHKFLPLHRHGVLSCQNNEFVFQERT